MNAATGTIADRVERFANDLVVTLVNLDMHDARSRQIGETTPAMLAELREITAAGAAGAAGAPSPLRLEIDAEELRFRDRPLVGASLQAGRLLRLCTDRSIAALVFEPQVTAGEIVRLLELLRDERHRGAFVPGRCEAALRSFGLRSVRVVLSAPRAPRRPSGGRARRQYQAMADFLQQNHVHAFRGDGIEMDAAAGVVEQAVHQMGEEPSGLLALAMCDDIDSFTVGHSVRVTLLALQVADAAGATRRDLLRVGTAALLHDIGKSRIPQDILFKAGTLDAEERQVMAQHARLGGEILLEQGGVDPTAIGAAFCHHMTPGGGGYPVPALPFEPSGVSKLVRICDVFEALTAVRPYKKAMSPVHAHVVMHRMRDTFDATWLRFFVHSIGLFPIGSRLRLDSGEEALVVGAGPTLYQPVAELCTDPGCGDQDADPDAPTRFTVGLPDRRGAARRIRAVVGADEQVEIPPEVFDPTCSGAAGCSCSMTWRHPE